MELVVVLLIVGVVLLLLETVLPGAIAGIVGFLCLVVAVVVSYDRFDIQTANLILLGVAIALIVGAIAWMQLFPKSALARPFVSKRTIGNIDTEKHELLEETGTAFSNLRPSGTAIINGKRVDVITEGEMIEQGAAIKVVQIEGLRVVVRRVNLSETENKNKSQTNV
jgi:membrane-bound serine protease (ClpP class)